MSEKRNKMSHSKRRGGYLPITLSLKFLRDGDWLAERTETKLGKYSSDLYGFIDILAIHPLTYEVMAVQTTDAAHFQDRIHKVRHHENLRHVVNAGWTVVVHGWRDDGTLREKIVYKRYDDAEREENEPEERADQP